MKEDLQDWQGEKASETQEPMDGGDVGGDAQQGTAWSRRCITRHDNGTFVVRDYYWYASRVGAEDYCVVRQEQTTECTDVEDVGGSETDCNVTYHTEFPAFTTLDDADAYARQTAREFSF